MTTLTELDAAIDYNLPLPKKIWAGWDDHPESRTPGSEILIRSPEIDVTADDAVYTLYVSTNGSYRLFLDDTEIPVTKTPDPAYWRFHRYDLSKHLTAGSRRLSFRVTAGTNLPFLLCCLDASSKEPSAHPDAPPKVRKRWVSDHTFEVSLDGGSTWEPAWAFEGVWAEPYGFAEGGPDDFARLTHGRQHIRHRPFASIVELHHGIWRWHAPAAGSPLRAETQPWPIPPPRAPWHRINQTMYHLIREGYCRPFTEWLDQISHRLPWVLLDAGRETFGRLVLRNAGKGPIQVCVVTGESPSETHYYNRRMGVVLSLSPGERATTPPIGFRYAKIHALSAEDGEFHLAEPLVQCIEYPAGQVGSFRSSDELLNTIWQFGADTVYLCTQNEIWDGIKRDLLPWMGDLHIENLIFLHTFADPFILRRSLQANRETGPALERSFRERIVPSMSVAWGGPAHDVNGMPSYTAWWVNGLCDYFLYTGDREYTGFEAAELVTLLDHLAAGVTENGWSFDAYHTPNDFIDHTIMSREEKDLAMGAISAAAFLRGADLLEQLGSPEDHARFDEIGLRLVSGYLKQVEGLNRDTLRHHAVSAALALGLLDPEQAQDLFANYIAVPDDELMSPWWRGYDLLAAATTGDIQWMLDEIRKRWGVMVGRGQTSLWECMDERWFQTNDPHACAITQEDSGYGGYRISLCHGWAGAPTVALHRGVLGVIPTAPGFKKFRWQPDLGDLDWAEGDIPTPQGPIHVRLEKQDREIRKKIDPPRGVQIEDQQ